MRRLTITPDNWLGEAMARTVARASIEPGQGDLTIDTDATRKLRETAFVYAKVPISSMTDAQTLEDAGFRLVDIAVELTAEKIAAASAKRGLVREATPRDRDAVAEVARSSFVWSRFHQDPHLPRCLADDLKAQWAVNFFSGQRGDAMVIDLIAVGSKARGNGLAAAMIAFAYAAWGRNLAMRVGTQLANTASLALYSRMGFRQTGASIVLHRHQLTGAA